MPYATIKDLCDVGFWVKLDWVIFECTFNIVGYIVTVCYLYNVNVYRKCQMRIIKKTQNIFLELHGLIDFRWAQTLVLPCAFSTTGTNLKVFRGTR